MSKLDDIGNGVGIGLFLGFCLVVVLVLLSLIVHVYVNCDLISKLIVSYFIAVGTIGGIVGAIYKEKKDA